MIDPRLTRKVGAAPDRPGVYLWKGADGSVLYVGKAKRLRARLRSYVQGRGLSPAHQAMMRHVRDVETIVVPNESQALLLENNLIKEHQPRYNIRLRDDKSYPFIVVTVREPFPRVLVVRRTLPEGAKLFGPYTDVAKLRQTLRVIRRLFMVRSCQYDLPHDRPDRPCLDYYIDRCRGPCVGYQSETAYRRMIDDVLLFLEGKTADVRVRLRDQMREASRTLDFERAAQLRDSIGWLDQLETRQSVEMVGGGSADVVGYVRDADDACAVVIRVRDGRVVGREYRFLENVRDAPDEEILTAFLVRHYVPFEPKATQLLLPFAPKEMDELSGLLAGGAVRIPQRGTPHRLVALAEQNAIHLFESFRLESFEADERSEDPVYALGRDLGLTAVPRAFVTIDISTNQGRDTSGSLVWFEAGRPKKSEYRHFRLRGPDAQQDDYAAIHEVVTRYLSRRIREHRPLPDLMVIDGGKGQLRAACDAAVAVDLRDLPIASLAKRNEDVYLPGRGAPLRLGRRSPSLKLLQRARDEAHRFAITYSRRRRSRRTIDSELLLIPGIGPSRRRRLLERFGSLAGIRTASPDEIATVPGFSNTLAERVLDHLGKD